jgi:hypothetical protein
MNLRTGMQRTITDHGAYSLRLTGRVLAWLGYFGDRVEALDLRTGKHYLLAHGSTGSKQIIGLGTWLGQSWQGKVIWEQGSSNPNSGPILDSLVVATVP